jgi:hypothetical protein
MAGGGRKPLTAHDPTLHASLAAIIDSENLIANTTTAKGLKVTCRLDRRKYQTGRKVGIMVRLVTRGFDSSIR